MPPFWIKREFETFATGHLHFGVRSLMHALKPLAFEAANRPSVGALTLLCQVDIH